MKNKSLDRVQSDLTEVFLWGSTTVSCSYSREYKHRKICKDFKYVVSCTKGERV